MTEHIKIVTLNCANCGAPLEIRSDMDRFACGHCGSAQIVERRGGTVSLRLIVDAVARVQVGTDKTAAELALVRLEKEYASVYAQWQTNRNNFMFFNNKGLKSYIELFREIFGGVNQIKASLAQFDAPYQKRLQELNELMRKNRAIVDSRE